MLSSRKTSEMRTANDDLLDIYYKNKKKMENKVTDPI